MKPIQHGGDRGGQIGRRAFIRSAVAGGAVVGVTSLAGCSPASPAIPPTQGAAGSSSPAAGAPTAQISPTPAAAQFKLGGTFKMSYQGEAANLDPHLLADLGSNAYGPGIA